MNKSRIKNCALYQEICILRILVQMGYLSKDELKGISQIAAEDYQATIIIDKNLVCCNF